MKKFGLIMAALFLMSSVHAWTLKTGTYTLSGGNDNWASSSYQGEVVIAPQGDNYSVIWRIGNRQAQVGVGILQSDVLSVAFTDVGNPSFWGVASFRVKAFGEIEGKWAGYDSTTTKPEYLVWKNYSTY